VPHAGAYADVLREAGVEPAEEDRRHAILLGLDAIGGWSDPASVLDEVVYLIESPIVLEGSFDERFLALPPRVIETAMQSHQRYFPLGGHRFAFVANGGDPALVRAGNERVLEGRLEDASFTFERDLRVGIEGLLERLPAITFVAGAGSMAEKSARLVRLVEALGGGDASKEAARLAKVDQAAELVREFPDLEGHIGAEYARLAGYPEEVSAAIEEQYLPETAGGPLPATAAGRVLAAAEKIDLITVAFSLGEKPSGSRDPYGLRRAAIGLCRLALEGRLEIRLAELVKRDIDLLAERGYGSDAAAVGLLTPSEVADFVEDFVEERLEGLLTVPVEFVRAARGASVRELGQVAQLALALASLGETRLQRLHTVYTRADRIVARAKDEDLPELRAELLVEAAEQEVSRVRDEVEAALVTATDFDRAAQAVERLAEPLERFFDEVLVMADDGDLRRNRLRLLSELRDLIRTRLGDLSELPG
jgi:glycyl-tRNA synthetase beta subunit